MMLNMLNIKHKNLIALLFPAKDIFFFSEKILCLINAAQFCNHLLTFPWLQLEEWMETHLENYKTRTLKIWSLSHHCDIWYFCDSNIKQSKHISHLFFTSTMGVSLLTKLSMVGSTLFKSLKTPWNLNLHNFQTKMRYESMLKHHCQPKC